MKKLLLLLTIATLGLAASAQNKYVGGDISLLTKYETNGAKYFDKDGVAITDMLSFLKKQKLNSMRVRLFVDPTKGTDRAACQDLDYVIALGKRIKDARFSFMLDFHYSDTWADPSNQWTPDAWKNMSDTELYTQIYNYTKSCLDEIVKAGATPDFIQIGNEISYGMLWGTKTSSTLKKYYAGNSSNRTRFITLLKKAGEACREVCPDAKIIIHTERVANANYLESFYKEMDSNGVDYDIAGISYYPYDHGTLEQLETALGKLETGISKPIMLVETGYYYAWQKTVEYGADLSATYPITPDGQKAYTIALIDLLNKHERVIGLYWWWLEACENGLDWNTKRVSDGWYNASLFNDAEKIKGKDGITYNYPAGYVMPALYELKNFLPNGGIIAGDANSDGTVNVTDVVAVVNYIMGNEPANFNKTAADMTNDGDINVTDIVKIVNVIMGNN